MASPGPRPTPTKLKLIKGNPGRRPLPENEPQPDPAVPEKPAWLDSAASDEWDRVVPILTEQGLLTHLDRAVLVAYCTAWADFAELYECVKEMGWTVPTADGGHKRNPLAPSLREAYERLKSAGAEFGMTPSARVRLVVGGGSAEDDPLERLMNRRKRR